MQKVKKSLAVGCGGSLAFLLVAGGALWIRGNAAPDYKLPEWKLPTPNAYDTLDAAHMLKVSKLGDISTSPTMRFDPKLQKSVPEKPQPLEGRKALLAKNQAAIAKIREALSQEFATPRQPGTLQERASDFPHFAEIRELTRLLSFASKTYAELGQKAEATRCALDAMALGLLVSHQSQLIGNLVGIACEAIGRKALWELTDQLDAKTVRQAIARLEALEPTRYSFEKVLLHERDFNQSLTYTTYKQANAWQIAESYVGEANEAFAMAQSLQVSEPLQIPGPMDRLRRLTAQTLLTGQFVWYTKRRIFAESGRYMTELAAQTKLPYSPQRPGPKLPPDPLNQLLMPVFAQAGQKDTATRAETALARVYLALRAYRLEKGSYPAALTELVQAGYLKSLPDDPFAPRFGQPFGYRRESDGTFTLWSCGPDGDDDKGQAIVGKLSNNQPRRYVLPEDLGDLVARVNTY